MWTENEIQLKKNQPVILQGDWGACERPGGRWCSVTSAALVQGWSAAAAPDPAWQPGGGAVFPTSWASRVSQQMMSDNLGTFCPTCQMGGLAPPMRTLSSHLLTMKCHRCHGGQSLLGVCHWHTADTFQLMTRSRLYGGPGVAGLSEQWGVVCRVVWEDAFLPGPQYPQL